tara:strand:- start:433 stop:930 length:498 start_codon:yes stop_codon:yes gene_type:complete
MLAKSPLEFALANSTIESNLLFIPLLLLLLLFALLHGSKYDVDVTWSPLSVLIVLAIIKKPFSNHRLVSNKFNSSASTHTSPSHRLSTVLVAPSGYTITRRFPISVIFVSETPFSLTKTSANVFSLCEIDRISHVSTTVFEASLTTRASNFDRANATPQWRTKFR